MTSRPSANRTPPEQVTILTGGVTVLVEGLDQRVGGKPVGTIELSADRMVIWSRGELAGRTGEEGTVQSEDEPFDVYMEGNVVMVQGDPTNPQLMRTVNANSATFDARESEELLRGFLSGELYRRGLICRTDDRGEPVIQLSPPLIAGPEQFAEIEAILRPVLTEAWERIVR